jgi:predicted phage tail protein
MKLFNIVGLTIFFLGAILLVGAAVYEIVKDVLSSGGTPTVVSLGVTAIILGVIIMIISLIVERARDSKKEDL